MAYENFLSSAISKTYDYSGRTALSSYEYYALIEKGKYGDSLDPNTKRAKDALATAKKVEGNFFINVSRNISDENNAASGGQSRI